MQVRTSHERNNREKQRQKSYRKFYLALEEARQHERSKRIGSEREVRKANGCIGVVVNIHLCACYNNRKMNTIAPTTTTTTPLIYI